MSGKECDLDTLAARVGRGDSAAAAELRRQLVPHLTRLVRLTLREGAGCPTLDPCILAEVRRAVGPGGAYAAADHAHLVDRVARRLCQSVLEGLRPRPHCAAGAADTVCGC